MNARILRMTRSFCAKNKDKAQKTSQKAYVRNIYENDLSVRQPENKNHQQKKYRAGRP